jgi:asparagine synthase (glutamine-hydrolysing)
MTARLHFVVELGDRWRRAGGTHARGSAAVDGEPSAGTALADRAEALSLDAATLLRIDGGFAVVRVTDDELVAAVDRLRTVPLFYAQHDGRLYLSDDAYWVAGQLPPHDFDEVCAAEFLLLGFVTGRDTLHPLVKQLQAGELLVARSDARRVAVSTHRYFTYDHHDYFTQPVDEILELWDATFRRIMERFVASAAGRTIAVPLSGGWDSRLMVLELKRLGYDDVRCFTYGRRGIDEVKIAREVAAQLGYPWEFVEYSVERWRAWHDAPEFARYVRYADGLCSVPHVQDWPAVWELRRAGRMPDDAIFAPGHNGGFLFGENGNLHRMRRPTLAALVHNLERVHYGNWRLDDPRMRARVRERLVGAVDHLAAETPEAATSAWERWEWQERQAKFMCNSVRVYEFWGFDWRLPFWDAEAIEFWERMPLVFRARNRLHRAYVGRASERESVSLPGDDRWKAIRSTFVRDYMPERLKRFLRSLRRLNYRRAHAEHEMGWFGIVELDDFRRLYRGTETINSVLALERLDQLPARARAHRQR